MNVATTLENLKKRFPNEPEYFQAVEEVLHSIEEEYNKHPEFEANNLIERLCIPDRIFTFRVTWMDDNGNVQVNTGIEEVHSGNVNARSSEDTLELRPERLDADADFSHSSILQSPQDIRLHIIGMQLHANSFGDDKVFLDGVDDFSEPICRKCRCATAKIQAGRFLFTSLLAAHSVDLLQQYIYVPVTQFL